MSTLLIAQSSRSSKHSVWAVVLLKTVMSFWGPVPDRRCEMHKGCVDAHCTSFILSG